MKQDKILIVEDEETLSDVMKLNLQNEGYEVDVANSAEQALTYDVRSYSLILLDIMMGEISGIQMAKILKAEPSTASIPIIFCTARDSEDDMVQGLNMGADDYIMKPFSIRNLVARVRSVLRRTGKQQDEADKETNNILKIEGLLLDLNLKQCYVDGKEVKLTKTEFELLEFLSGISHHVMSCLDHGLVFLKDVLYVVLASEVHSDGATNVPLKEFLEFFSIRVVCPPFS